MELMGLDVIDLQNGQEIHFALNQGQPFPFNPIYRLPHKAQ